MSDITVINESNFDEQVAQADKPVLLDFWAPWCGPCLALMPTIEKLQEEVGDKFVIGKVNVDENQKLAVQFNVSAVPTLVFLKEGEIRKQLAGLQPENTIRETLESLE